MVHDYQLGQLVLDLQLVPETLLDLLTLMDQLDRVFLLDPLTLLDLLTLMVQLVQLHL